MSTLFVNVTEVRDVLPHGNADKLEVIKVYDWEVIVAKGAYRKGDKVIYVPVDAILPHHLENRIFPIGSKIKLHNSRIRSIKLRGRMSQGMAIMPVEISDVCPFVMEAELETNLAPLLDITKYEPPETSMPNNMRVAGKSKPKVGNSNFRKYCTIEHFKYFDRIFEDGEEVYVSEKLHGTSARYGWVPAEANTFWKKIKKFFGALETYEYCWGSRNMQIQDKMLGHSGFASAEQGVNFGDVYTKISKQYDLQNKIPKQYAVYGEIVGDGIQRDYNYGCDKDEHKFYVYDVMFEGKYLSYKEFKDFTQMYHLDVVPEMYVGPFKRHLIDPLVNGDSVLGSQKDKEGLVIRTTEEKSTGSLSRKVVKFISDNYYMNRNNTDFH